MVPFFVVTRNVPTPLDFGEAFYIMSLVMELLLSFGFATRKSAKMWCTRARRRIMCISSLTRMEMKMVVERHLGRGRSLEGSSSVLLEVSVCYGCELCLLITF